METIVFTRPLTDFDVFTDDRERMIQAAFTDLRHEAQQNMMQIMEERGPTWFKIDIVMRNPVDFAMTMSIALNLHYQPMELPVEGARWDWQPAVAPPEPARHTRPPETIAPAARHRIEEL
jgi:hypothetical protein